MTNLERKLPDWLGGYLEYTKGTEPPLSYQIWTGISLISGALQRRTHIKWGYSKIYPNIYVVLVGPSGQARKGEAMNIGRPFAEHVGLSVPSKSITREAFIAFLSKATTSFDNGDGQIELMSPVMVMSPELAVFMGQADIKFLADLTDMYDSADSWEYETRGRGEESITGVCVTLLGALAPDWLPSMLPREALGGGWTARTIFVVEEKKRQIVPGAVQLDPDLRDALEHDLEQIANLAGAFTFSEEGRIAYEEWYERYERAWAAGNPPIHDPKFDGYCARRATHARKLAMCLSASRGNDLVIHEEDFQRARRILEETEKRMPKAFAGLGRSDISYLTNMVLSWIKLRGELKRSELMSRLYEDVDLHTLERIELVLMAMKVVEIHELVQENDKLYVFTAPRQLSAVHDSSDG